MPLLDEMQGAMERLKRAEAARGGLEESQALEEQRKTLLEKHDALQRLALRAEILRGNSVATTAPQGIAQLRTRLQSVTAQFSEARVAAALKSNRRMTGLTTAINAFMENAAGAQATDWRDYYSSKLFAGLPPASIEARIAPTPKNNEALARYKALFSTFAAFRNRIPETQEEFVQVKSTSAGLAQIKFEENVPPAVAKFFAATASNIGASLDLLTPEVLDWLQDKHMLDKYVVRAHVK